MACAAVGVAVASRSSPVVLAGLAAVAGSLPAAFGGWLVIDDGDLLGSFVAEVVIVALLGALLGSAVVVALRLDGRARRHGFVAVGAGAIVGAVALVALGVAQTHAEPSFAVDRAHYVTESSAVMPPAELAALLQQACTGIVRPDAVVTLRPRRGRPGCALRAPVDRDGEELQRVPPERAGGVRPRDADGKPIRSPRSSQPPTSARSRPPCAGTLPPGTP